MEKLFGVGKKLTRELMSESYSPRTCSSRKPSVSAWSSPTPHPSAHQSLPPACVHLPRPPCSLAVVAPYRVHPIEDDLHLRGFPGVLLGFYGSIEPSLPALCGFLSLIGEEPIRTTNPDRMGKTGPRGDLHGKTVDPQIPAPPLVLYEASPGDDVLASAEQAPVAG